MDDPTRAHLRTLIDANWTTQAIAVAVQLGLPDKLAGAPRSAPELARQAACHAPSMLRLLRALTSIGILAQDDAHDFSLTDMGRLLLPEAPGSLAAWAELCGTTAWVAWGRLHECVRSGDSVRKQGGGDDGFTYLEHDAQAARLFNRAMTELSRSVAVAVVRDVRFIGDERVVDVGGGLGTLLSAILTAHSRMRGVLFDMAHAIEPARANLVEAGVADRCTCVVGSFFDAVPGQGDIYLLKSILHDWPDGDCAAILVRCAQAMAPDARLLIVERVVPEKMSVSAQDQGIARMDLNMLIRQGGQERTLEQYRALVTAAGLRLCAEKTVGGGFSVLEALHR